MQNSKKISVDGLLQSIYIFEINLDTFENYG